MKLREWLDGQGEMGKALTREGGGFDYFTTILDAEVIGLPCPTCGGSEKCPQCEGKGKYYYKDTGAGEETVMLDCEQCGGTGTCPDCADTPVWVTAPEAWGRTQDVLENMVNEVDPNYLYEDVLHAILQALLPGARVAENILKVDGFLQHGGITEFYDADAKNPEPQDIAILIRQAREGKEG